MVTGSNGFIGRNVLIELQNQKDKYKLCGIDIGVNANNSILSRYYSLDLINESIKTAVEEFEPDVIIHCAGLADVNKSVVNPSLDFKFNVEVTQNIIYDLIALQYKKRVVFLSSAAVYGQPQSLPITECFSKRPMSPYALHKSIAEEICQFAHNIYGIDIVILRVFSAYGDGLKKQLLWDMCNKYKNNKSIVLYGNGNESRDYIHIFDLRRVIANIATFNGKLKYNIYNVASGKETTIKEIANIFVEIINDPDCSVVFSNIEHKGNPSNWCADIGRLSEFGFSTKINMFEGINKYINWFNTEGKDEKIRF